MNVELFKSERYANLEAEDKALVVSELKKMFPGRSLNVVNKTVTGLNLVIYVNDNIWLICDSDRNFSYISPLVFHEAGFPVSRVTVTDINGNNTSSGCFMRLFITEESINEFQGKGENSDNQNPDDQDNKNQGNINSGNDKDESFENDSEKNNSMWKLHMFNSKNYDVIDTEIDISEDKFAIFQQIQSILQNTVQITELLLNNGYDRAQIRLILTLRDMGYHQFIRG